MAFASGVLQLHPTRQCNLACAHCYSRSGPTERESVPAELLERAIDDAAALGWRYVSVSGGEPLVYPGLRRLLTRARSRGLLTSLTTNGTLLPRLAGVADALDLVAISLDGLGAAHDRGRGRPGAFERLVQDLPAVRATGVPFAFLHTLTRDNVGQLERVADFAAQAGAAALQIHPLAADGRGEGLEDAVPTDEDAARAWLEVWRLRTARKLALPIRLDLADLATLRDGGDTLAELLSPLVIEADGTVVPLQHGFPRAWALGSLYDAPLRALVGDWPRLAEFGALCRRTLRGLATERDLPFVDPYRELARAVARAA